MFKTVCLFIKTCTNATANENQIYLNDLCLQQEGDTPLFGLGTWGVFRAYLGLENLNMWTWSKRQIVLGT